MKFRVMFSNGSEHQFIAPTFARAVARAHALALSEGLDDLVPVMMVRLPSEGPWPVYVNQRVESFERAVKGVIKS